MENRINYSDLSNIGGGFLPERHKEAIKRFYKSKKILDRYLAYEGRNERLAEEVKARFERNYNRLQSMKEDSVVRDRLTDDVLGSMSWCTEQLRKIEQDELPPKSGDCTIV